MTLHLQLWHVPRVSSISDLHPVFCAKTYESWVLSHWILAWWWDGCAVLFVLSMLKEEYSELTDHSMCYYTVKSVDEHENRRHVHRLRAYYCSCWQQFTLENCRRGRKWYTCVECARRCERKRPTDDTRHDGSLFPLRGRHLLCNALCAGGKPSWCTGSWSGSSWRPKYRAGTACLVPGELTGVLMRFCVCFMCVSVFQPELVFRFDNRCLWTHMYSEPAGLRAVSYFCPMCGSCSAGSVSFVRSVFGQLCPVAAPSMCFWSRVLVCDRWLFCRQIGVHVRGHYETTKQDWFRYLTRRDYVFPWGSFLWFQEMARAVNWSPLSRTLRSSWFWTWNPNLIELFSPPSTHVLLGVMFYLWFLCRCSTRSSIKIVGPSYAHQNYVGACDWFFFVWIVGFMWAQVNGIVTPEQYDNPCNDQVTVMLIPLMFDVIFKSARSCATMSCARLWAHYPSIFVFQELWDAGSHLVDTRSMDILFCFVSDYIGSMMHIKKKKWYLTI